MINVRKWFKVKPSQGQSVVASAGCTGANLDLPVVQRRIHIATYYPTTAGEYRLEILGGQFDRNFFEIMELKSPSKTTPFAYRVITFARIN